MHLEDLMTDAIITNEMKRHAVIVPIKANHRNLEIARFLKVATSFICKVRKELNENNEARVTMGPRGGEKRFVNALLTHNTCSECKCRDANVETLQTIVKPPWIDDVANGGRLYVCQQDSASSHKARKTHDWMVENFHYHNPHIHASLYYHKLNSIRVKPQIRRLRKDLRLYTD
ncbi:hypothetical protein ACTXT7_009377 [Hymenolepis weldensis]